jgi:lysozyme
MNRVGSTSLKLSAVALVGLALFEGYTDRAIQPLPGDKWTYGFGTTDNVKRGDTITPPKALERKLADIAKFESALKQCVVVPLYQYEYDAYISLSYNIGSNAFCGSTLVRLLNNGKYKEACEQILRWDKFKGSAVRGLTIRRQAEYKQCIGQ